MPKFQISEDESLSAIDSYIEDGLTPEDLGTDLADFTSLCYPEKKRFARRRLKSHGVLWYAILENALLRGVVRPTEEIERVRAM